MSILIFYIYWCDTKFTYRKFALYGKEVPKSLVCMLHDSMQYHESFKVELNDKTFYVCSHYCYHHLIECFQEHALVPDAFSGDTICKANAVVGFKEKGKPNIIYFKNIKNLNKYYATRKNKKIRFITSKIKKI